MPFNVSSDFEHRHSLVLFHTDALGLDHVSLGDFLPILIVRAYYCTVSHFWVCQKMCFEFGWGDLIPLDSENK